MTDNGSETPDTNGGDLAGILLSGRYQLDEQIGSGGMGAVWRATDTLLNRPVAVKLLHLAQMAEPTSRERFRTEGRITAGLSHPGIAQVYDYGEQNDRAFLIMEFVPGEPLSSILRRNEGGLESGATLDIIGQAAQALAAAHARGVIHRDMKPGNLLVTEDGTVKLTDFGIARGDQSVTLTQTGMVMGTAQYISPEQASGGSATFASDLYSLGVVAYECLTGQPPFTADTPLALALAHTREPPPPLPPHIPAPIGGLVRRLLEKSPGDRPSSAGEVAQAAQQLRGGISPTFGGATSAMDLADETMLAGAAGADSAPSTRPNPSGADRTTASSSGFGDHGGTSDRVAERPPPRRPRLPIVLAAIAFTAVVVVGVVLAGRLWGGAGQGDPQRGDPTPKHTESSTSHSTQPTEDQDTGDARVDDDDDQETSDGPQTTDDDQNTSSPSSTDDTQTDEPTGTSGPPDPGDGTETDGPGDGTETDGPGDGNDGGGQDDGGDNAKEPKSAKKVTGSDTGDGA